MRTRLYGLAVALASAAAITAHSQSLCPRGTYAVTASGSSHTLSAKVTLPTPGYKVTFKQGPEKTNPPTMHFLCEKPTNIVPQVLTEHSASTAIKGDSIFVLDAAGSTKVSVTSAAQPVACNANADCKGAGEFCNTTPSCAPKSSGKCMKKPEVCTEEFKPVEGCDGKTYGNACKASAAGVSSKGGPKQ